MELIEFVKNIAEQFEDTDTTDFNEHTKFRENDEYSSLTGLSIIAMVDEVYNIKITGEEIRSSHTIMDLYNIVCAKM